MGEGSVVGVWVGVVGGFGVKDGIGNDATKEVWDDGERLALFFFIISPEARH